MSFTRDIQPYVESEFELAASALAEGHGVSAFKHLENAHVLGQASTKWHTLAHLRMLTWAIRHRDVREFLGQVFRIVGAVTKTAIGLLPTGNTGGANVSPFRPMALSPEHEAILRKVGP